MNKKFALLALASLVSISSAATAVVWDENGNGTMPALGAYTYKYPDKTNASIDTSNVDNVKVLKFSVPKTTTSAGAGYGFAWKQGSDWNPVKVSLSSYKGVCMTYKASYQFRLDFQQYGIDDSKQGYWGALLPAASDFKSTFISFSGLTLGWGNKSTAVAWNVANQLGVQLSYKSDYVKTDAAAKNEVQISKFILADECVTAAPNVTEAFTGYNGGAIELDEGAVHTMNMAEVFEDADGDDLTITVKIVSENNSIKLVDSTKYDQNSIIKFTTVANPEGPATVTLTATDPTNKTATFEFTINTTDTENLPVAKDIAFEVLEDSSYRNGLLTNNLLDLCSDADGDKVVFALVDQPAHGTLDADIETGIFTYAPAKDYFGKDSFTYQCSEENDPTRVSEVGTATITVVNVNDDADVEIVGRTFLDSADEEHAFGDTLVADEDFKAFFISIPKANIVVTDADGDDDIVIAGKTSGIVTATYTSRDEYYALEISAVKDANGVAKVSLAVGDHESTIAIPVCYIKVNPVADDPVPVADVYTIPQDSLFKVDVKDGLLANDFNPDSVEVSVVLVVDPENGTLTLAKDGSFTYISNEGFKGKDAFAYQLNYGTGTSKMAIVTINVVQGNKSPKVKEGVLDTVGTRLAGLTEDFTTVKKYTKAELLSWFEDDTDKADSLKYTVRSDDSLLAPSIASGVISIKAVKDACGEAEIIVTATDKDGASTDLRIPASISCVNDKPVIGTLDTIYVNSDSAWTVALDLNKYITDPDGDTLTYTVVAQSMVAKVDGDTLRLSANEGVRYMMGMTFAVSIKAADAATSVSTIVYITLGAPAAVKPMIAAPKATWQNAILANRGMAAIFDMQGRVMWKQKLPVSESEVRNAAAQVQGRKILQVNKQTWTIK